MVLSLSLLCTRQTDSRKHEKKAQRTSPELRGSTEVKFFNFCLIGLIATSDHNFIKGLDSGFFMLR